MAKNRKLDRTTDQRLAMPRTQTTEAREKEVKAIADSIIALAIKEKDNF